MRHQDGLVCIDRKGEGGEVVVVVGDGSFQVCTVGEEPVGQGGSPGGGVLLEDEQGCQTRFCGVVHGVFVGDVGYECKAQVVQAGVRQGRGRLEGLFDDALGLLQGAGRVVSGLACREGSLDTLLLAQLVDLEVVAVHHLLELGALQLRHQLELRYPCVGEDLAEVHSRHDCQDKQREHRNK